MIDLQNIDNKETIIKDFFIWLFDDERIINKDISLQSEVDLSLAPYYIDANIYYPKPIADFFQTDAMKRLGRISQLSLVSNDHSTYHTRLEHSKGTYNRKLEELINNFQDPDWRNFIEKNHFKLYLLADLFKVAGHDIGHLPFSHALEEEIYGSHGAHEIFGKRIMLENDEINSILMSISPVLPIVLKDLYEKDILNFSSHDEGNYDVDRLDFLLRDSIYIGYPKELLTQPYKTVKIKTDSSNNPLLNSDYSIIESNDGNSYIDVYEYESLPKIENFLDLRLDLYSNIYMSEKSKMCESAIGVFLDTFLSTDSEYGKSLRNFINIFKNNNIQDIDLSEFLQWDDIKLYSQIFEIAEHHHNPQIRTLASMIVPNIDSFLNMMYSYLDPKNTDTFSNEDLAFLKIIKQVIQSDTEFSKNLRDKDLVNINTLKGTVDCPLDSKLDSNYIYSFDYKLKGYSNKSPIYIRGKDGKVFELPNHPERHHNWNKKDSLIHYEYSYIPLLKLNGFSNDYISQLKDTFQQQEFSKSDYLQSKFGNKTVNMCHLAVGHNIEDAFLQL